MTTHHHPTPPTRTLLAPEDAYNTLSTSSGPLSHRHSARSRSRRRKATWKKLLWVKQSYPDNYTDEATFLDALQRNPRLRPYEFWPLVADSTVIVQQVCTMVVFVCCFSGIMQGRVSPVTVVTWGTVGAVVGWGVWDYWVGQQEAAKVEAEESRVGEELGTESGQVHSVVIANGNASGPGHTNVNSSTSSFSKEGQGLGLRMTPSMPSMPSAIPGTPRPAASAPAQRKGHSRQSSSGSVRFNNNNNNPASIKDSVHREALSQSFPSASPNPNVNNPTSKPSPSTRNQQRIATAKSAILICGALLGLSPILKSLTKSTASDSIWAIAFWLMLINVIFFDYGGGVGATFPASLSTNAALMASTVLASRLAIANGADRESAPTDAQSTAHVFSLTLFSIEVFGLFPVFRRYLRHISWTGHLSLTWGLVMGAGAGVSMVLSGGGLPAAIVGAILGSLLMGLSVGICAWWLIGLQRFKNEIHGPWDPARPVIRRWD